MSGSLRLTTLVLLMLGFLMPVRAQVPDEPDVMVTNGIRHSVPLDKIIFDTFSPGPNRALPYTQATPAVIERLRDAIRPIYEPVYESVEDGNRWLGPNDLIVGYIASDGAAYAYPFKILNFHEIVNDTLAGQPILISYCPLCNSAIVYSRIVDGQELLFGNTSALYESDLVMFDHQTDSYWFQVSGRAILGPLTNKQLEVLPSIVTTWGQWQTEHPDSYVLARPFQGLDYSRDPFAGYADVVNNGRFFFPVDEAIVSDRRLLAGENVLLVEIGDEARAYPLAQIGNDAVVDTVGGQQIVVLSLEDGPSGAAYIPETTSGVAVRLVFDEGTGMWRDIETDSTFNLNGTATSGPLAGERLSPVPARYTFWFAAVASTPHVQVYTPS